MSIASVVRLRTRRVLIALLVPATLLVLPAAAGAVERTWDGSGSSDFLVAGNWSPAGVPAIGDDLIIPATSPNIPNISASLDAASLKIGGPLVISDGTLNVASITMATGAAVQQTGGGVNVGSSVEVDPVANADPMAWSLGSGVLNLADAPVADFGPTVITMDTLMQSPQLNLGANFSAAYLVWERGVVLGRSGGVNITDTNFSIQTGGAIGGDSVTLGTGTVLSVTNGNEYIVELADLIVDGGVITTAGTGRVVSYPGVPGQGIINLVSGSVVADASTAHIVGSAVTVDADLQLPDDTSLLLDDTTVQMNADIAMDSASMTLTGTSLFEARTTARRIDGGTIIWSSSTLNSGTQQLELGSELQLVTTGTGTLALGSGGAAIEAGVRMIVSGAAPSFTGPLTIDSGGTLQIATGSNAVIPGLTNLDDDVPGEYVLSDGEYDIQGTGTLTLAHPITALAGTTSLAVGSTNPVRTGGNNALADLAFIEGGSALEVTSGATATLAPQVAVGGTLLINGTVDVDDTINMGSTAFVGGAGVIDTGDLQASGGTLNPNGLQITGDLNMNDDVTTRIALDDATVNTPFLEVDGAAGLGGTLLADPTDYDVDYTDEFAFIEADMVLGNFDSITPLPGAARVIVVKDELAETARLQVTELVAPNVVPVVDFLTLSPTTTTRPTIVFTSGSDADSGIDTTRYSIEFSQSATSTLPDTVAEAVIDQRFQAPSDLTEGTWYAHVRNVDQEGNWAATAGHSAAFIVDVTAPTAPAISGGPAATTEARTATFTVTGEAGATLQCSLDGAAFTTCTSQVSFANLALGAHTFSARAVDAVGHVGAASTFVWTIQQPAVVVTPPKPVVVKPTAKADKITGSGIRDIINGLGGNDVLRGLGGNDVLKGGAGNDKLDGGTGNDTLDGGPGKDTIAGAAGNDTIAARDRTRDVISCGPGKDKVVADKIDKVAKDCEKVSRR